MSLTKEQLQEIVPQTEGYYELLYEYAREGLEFQRMYNTLMAGYTTLAAAAQSILTYETVKCFLDGNYNAYVNKMIQLYPAIATGERMLSDTQSLIDIIRQGIVIKPEDKEDILFYIGGFSPYWASGNLLVYQGGTVFGGGDVKIAGGVKLQGKKYLQKLRSLYSYNNVNVTKYMNLVVIPLLAKRNLNFINPTYYSFPPAKNYKETIGIFKNSNHLIEMLSYQPYINYLALRYRTNFYYIKEGSRYISETFTSGGRELLRISSEFPYPYVGFFNPTPLDISGYATQLFLGLAYIIAAPPKLMPLYSTKVELYPPFYDYFNTAINFVSLGAPIYLSNFDPNASNNCSTYGVVGLVSGILDFTAKIGNSITQDRSILSQIPSLEFELGIYVLPVVKLPDSTKYSDIIEYAEALKVNDYVNYLLEIIDKAKRAISSLISSGVLSGIAFAAVMAVEAWDSEDQIVKDAQKYIEKLNEIYNYVLNQAYSCIESFPNLPRNEKIIYEEQVQQYLNGIIGDVDARLDKNEIISFLMEKINEYLSNQGIYCFSEEVLY
ncbi:hypothetical protein [Sulfurisphaera javensis]